MTSGGDHWRPAHLGHSLGVTSGDGQAGGVHPTGMLSCLFCFGLYNFGLLQLISLHVC